MQYVKLLFSTSVNSNGSEHVQAQLRAQLQKRVFRGGIRSLYNNYLKEVIVSKIIFRNDEGDFGLNYEDMRQILAWEATE